MCLLFRNTLVTEHPEALMPGFKKKNKNVVMAVFMPLEIALE